MSNIHQIYVLQKEGQVFATISASNDKDTYLMLYAAVANVAKRTNKSIPETLDILEDLDNYLKTTGQIQP